MDDIAIYLNRQPSSTSLHYVQGRTWRQRCGSCTRKLHLFRLLLFSRRVCVCVHVSYLQFASQFRARLTLDVPPRRVARKIETIIPDFRREKNFFFFHRFVVVVAVMRTSGRMDERKEKSSTIESNVISVKMRYTIFAWHNLCLE